MRFHIRPRPPRRDSRFSRSKRNSEIPYKEIRPLIWNPSWQLRILHRSNDQPWRLLPWTLPHRHHGHKLKPLLHQPQSRRPPFNFRNKGIRSKSEPHQSPLRVHRPARPRHIKRLFRLRKLRRPEESGWSLSIPQVTFNDQSVLRVRIE